MRMIILAAFEISLAASAFTAPAVGGIYLVIPMNVAIDGGPALVQQSLAKPFVDGGYVLTRWREAEPRPGEFDWSYLDAQVKALAALGKKVSIGVAAGQSSPDWLYEAGAKSFDTVVEIPRQKDFCQRMRTPLPWDETFLKEWTEFVEALGKHFALNPHVTLVKMTGIAYRTDELLLPRETARHVTGQGRECAYPDDLRHWREAGYSLAKIERAFARILNAYSKAFPNTSIALMTGIDGLPAIGDEKRSDKLAADIPDTEFFRRSRRVLGDQFIAQVNSLTSFRFHEQLAAFGREGGRIAYQEAWPVTNDADCHMSGKKPCDPVATMRKTVDMVERTRATYVELFKEDLTNPVFESMWKELHQQLQR